MKVVLLYTVHFMGPVEALGAGEFWRHSPCSVAVVALHATYVRMAYASTSKSGQIHYVGLLTPF
ncbi:hypothetical protein SLEP1_g8286 [Rubroshorea leprosula]|uniref:Secreted protein n=1 Tax=Rubroshorea leprosula TaxID=152421 RepID=A0AAV5I133_9ROSI|nr:hypothetical protein SLEP1_g8286 [Rubroshorea leprosula]